MQLLWTFSLQETAPKGLPPPNRYCSMLALGSFRGWVGTSWQVVYLRRLPLLPLAAAAGGAKGQSLPVAAAAGLHFACRRRCPYAHLSAPRRANHQWCTAARPPARRLHPIRIRF